MAISEFILARIAEDEALADQALDGRSVDDPWNSESDGAHFNQWNPWRVQSACIARRLLVRAHRNTGPVVVRMPARSPELLAATCGTCRGEDDQPALWPCYTLRVLASEWSHHPDYREEWRPQLQRRRTPSQASASSEGL